MAIPLRVLVLEDRPADAELAVETLRREGFEPHWQRVETEQDYLAALHPGLDVILADHSLPQFDSVLALERLQQRGLDVPFIVVSGTINEELAVALMKHGAADYVLKDRLGRLGPAVRNALEARRLRLAERQALLQMRLQVAALTAAANAIAITNRDGIILWVNPAFTTITGYSPAEAQGQNPRLLKSGKHDQAFYRQLWDTILAGQVWRGELINRRKDGTLYFEEQTITPVRDEQGAIAYFVGIKQDVTQRKQAEAERQQLMARLQLQIERMPMGYMLLDADLRIIDWNPAAERIFGYKKEEILGEGPPYEKIVPAQAWPQIEERVRRLRAGDMTAQGVNENRTRDGRTITCEWYNTPLLDAAGTFTGLLALAQDITRRKMLEEQYRQAQKMEAIGRLAGGVAHDFNNLLTVINGYGELLLGRLPAGDPSRELIREMVAAGDRAAGLTRQLLSFSRKAIVEPRVLDLKAVLADLDRMLRRIIGEDIQLTVAADPHVGAVRADSGQIEQVILNLVVNARDAMPTGGRLTIELRNAELDERYTRDHADVRPGLYALLAVSDTGCGMDEATRARIFEPFFSTKGEHGTGLGLATVHGIVKQSGGHIAVYSEVGVGTTFKVYLPHVEQPPVPFRPRSGETVLPLGSETVLLVEDEDGVRALVRHILQRCGYTVLEARDGIEALRLVEQHRGHIDLLLSDVVMPRMGGRELAERLTARHPGLKVLYLSGYTDDAVVRHGILQSQVAFLQKPFSTMALATRVREVLG